jgi:hypothetical protein
MVSRWRYGGHAKFDQEENKPSILKFTGFAVLVLVEWFYKGHTQVLQCCSNVVPLVPQRSSNAVILLLKVLQWCNSGLTVVSQDHSPAHRAFPLRG